MAGEATVRIAKTGNTIAGTITEHGADPEMGPKCSVVATHQSQFAFHGTITGDAATIAVVYGDAQGQGRLDVSGATLTGSFVFTNGTVNTVADTFRAARR